MINITVKKQNNNIVEITAEGHSGYAESGKDIICASISSILQTAVLGIKEVVKINAKIIINDKKPLLQIKLPVLTEQEMEKAQIVLQTAYVGIKNIAFENKKYIKMED